jgi:hypothetical protein
MPQSPIGLNYRLTFSTCSTAHKCCITCQLSKLTSNFTDQKTATKPPSTTFSLLQQLKNVIYHRCTSYLSCSISDILCILGYWFSTLPKPRTAVGLRKVCLMKLNRKFIYR